MKQVHRAALGDVLLGTLSDVANRLSEVSARGLCCDSYTVANMHGRFLWIKAFCKLQDLAAESNLPNANSCTGSTAMS